MASRHVRSEALLIGSEVGGRKVVSVESILNNINFEDFSIAEDQKVHAELQPFAAQTNGYLFSQKISGSSCASTPYYVKGGLTNTCIVQGGHAQYSYCENGKAYVNYYNATSCTNAADIYNSEIAILGCSRSHVNGGISIESAGCSTNTGALPLTSEYYAVSEYFTGVGCTGTIVGFTATLNNKCIADEASGQSQMVNYPFKTYYSTSLSCAGPSTTSQIYSPECTTQVITDDTAGKSSTGYSQSVLLQGLNPTPRPTINYVAASAIGSDDDNALSLGPIAGITIGISGFIGIVFLLGFYFAVKSVKRSSSNDGQELTKNVENPVNKGMF